MDVTAILHVRSGSDRMVDRHLHQPIGEYVTGPIDDCHNPCDTHKSTNTHTYYAIIWPQSHCVGRLYINSSVNYQIIS